MNVTKAQPAYIGIMVNTPVFRGIPSGKTFHEAIEFYEEAALHYGLKPCYFRLQDIQPASGTVQAYVKGTFGYIKRRIPIPQVIHNRGFQFHPQARQRLLRLAYRGKMVFNQRNRYGKLFVHQLLMRNPQLVPHLPETVKASSASLKRMMQRYDSLMIKPSNGSVGLGIMKLDRKPYGWSAARSVGHRPPCPPFKASCIPVQLRRRFARREYIVQQRIPLATFQGRPFDLRVSVQRDGTGEWQVTGIAGKAAARNKFVTNVVRGGTVYALNVLLVEYPELNPETVRRQVEALALAVAAELSLYFPDLADVGLDIGITKEGFPMFIECNGRDLRLSFREGNMMDVWKSTFHNPVAYANYLLHGHAEVPAAAAEGTVVAAAEETEKPADFRE